MRNDGVRALNCRYNWCKWHYTSYFCL